MSSRHVENLTQKRQQERKGKRDASTKDESDTRKIKKVPIYTKVNVIEKTAKFDSVTQDKKTIPKAITRDSNSFKRQSGKVSERLTKFESSERGKRASARSKGSNTSDLVRKKSLRSEKISDRIAKLETKNAQEKKSDSASSSKNSSATSSRSSISDSATSTGKTLTRAEQALESHKSRMRSSKSDKKSTKSADSSKKNKHKGNKTAEEAQSPSKARDKGCEMNVIIKELAPIEPDSREEERKATSSGHVTRDVTTDHLPTVVDVVVVETTDRSPAPPDGSESGVDRSGESENRIEKPDSDYTPEEAINILQRLCDQVRTDDENVKVEQTENISKVEPSVRPDSLPIVDVTDQTNQQSFSEALRIFGGDSSGSPVKSISGSPITSTVGSPDKSPVFTTKSQPIPVSPLKSPVKSVSSSPGKYPVNSTSGSPYKSPTLFTESPSIFGYPATSQDLISPVLTKAQSITVSPVTSPDPVLPIPSPDTRISIVSSGSGIGHAMLSSRRRPRLQKCWLDESDSDSVSLLSDAASDASEVDLEWLGYDSEDDRMHVTLGRSASSAQEMMRMWEEKARARDDDVSGKQTINGHSSDVVTSPRRVVTKATAEESQPRTVGGAKALFENLSKSPKKSPLRSPRKRIELGSESSNDFQGSNGQASDNEESQIVGNIRAMFENRKQDKKQTKKQKTSESEPHKKKHRSNVQRRSDSRKQDKRSMTQPITTHDVMKAQDSMNKSNAANSDSEEELNFVERLKFFKQLSTKPKKGSVVRRQSESRENFQAKTTHDAKTPDSEISRKNSSSSSSTIDEPESGRRKVPLNSEMSESITERMSRLRNKQKEEKWRKENRRSEVKSSVSERLNSLKGQEERWKKSNPEFVTRVDKLSDRIAKIKEGTESWKNRTGKQNDAAQFTIQAKLAKREGKKLVSVLPSPVVKRRVISSEIVTQQKAVTIDDAHKSDDSSSMTQLSFVEKLSKKGLEENVIKTQEVLTIEVPTIDQQEFDKFFTQPSPHQHNHTNHLSEDIENFPSQENFCRLSDLGRLKSSVKMRTKRKPSQRNPLKALAARTDIKQSYDTERSNVVKLEQQRIASQRGYGANFTSAALAGLAAKADLKKVSLRSTKQTPMLSNDDLKPFHDVMLIRAKGRRKVQTRIVEPRASSLSSDDAFLLVTPNKLFGWFGEYSNVIERAKINEIADYIVIKGDLGCKVSSLKSIEENSSPTLHSDFWDILGGHGDWDRNPSPGSDENYEVDVETTIKTYKMTDSKLVPHPEAWGRLPKMSMLQPPDTFVFDFGAEMYIWQGKEVSFADRRLAIRLARVLWEEEYDFTEQGVCPFHGKDLKGKRPVFGLFARVNENLETSLFQEKFDDWSNIHRETAKDEAILRENNRGKTESEIGAKTEIAIDLQPCDVVKMMENKPKHSPIIVDGFDVALGDGEIVDGDGRVLEIVTSETELFLVSENSVEKMRDSVLHRANSYVVEWKYSISSRGRFENSKTATSTTETDSSTSGRERIIYFSWVGSDSGRNEKGACALIASTMDTGEWPVMSVSESTSPLAFDKCFDGALTIENGKHGSRRGSYTWKMFRVKGTCEKSVSLVEVPCCCKSLRSFCSFVLLQKRNCETILWNGTRTSNCRLADVALRRLNNRVQGLKTTREEEGKESEHFWEAVGLKRVEHFSSLSEKPELETRATRVWEFTIDANTFSAQEISPRDVTDALAVEQSQMTRGLFLVDCTFGTFLYHKRDECDVTTASAKRRDDVIKRLAVETAIDFCKKFDRAESIWIESGNETTDFTNAFPTWKEKEKSARLKLVKPTKVSQVLSKLTRVTYTLQELTAKELPDGVDARHLETYLSNRDFEQLFQMTKAEYYKLPAWKQIKLRREKNFF